MDGFDANSFDETNPFSDSSINQARKEINQHEGQIDSYNPYMNDQYMNYNPYMTDQFTHQPAVIQPSETRSSAIVPQNFSSAISSEITNMTIQQENLEKRASELDRRERELNARAAVMVSENNFPPLPSCFPCKPCFVQNIDMDIPQPFQLIVRVHFYIWIAFTVLMLLNLVGSLAYLIVDNTKESGTTFGLSIFYFISLPPLSYVFWFRAVYRAFKNDSSLSYFMYFIIFFIHNCINIFWCIGIPSSGGVGFINGLGMIKQATGVGVLMIIIGILFGAIGGVGIALILRVLHFYRNVDASFKKAQEEFTSGVLSSHGAQQTVINSTSAVLERPSRF